MPLISKVLGHGDIETMARYANLALNSIHGMVGRIAESIAVDIL